MYIRYFKKIRQMLATLVVAGLLSLARGMATRKIDTVVLLMQARVASGLCRFAATAIDRLLPSVVSL